MNVDLMRPSMKCPKQELFKIYWVSPAFYWEHKRVCFVILSHPKLRGG